VNASLPIVSSVSGSFTLFSAVHSLNVVFSIVVKPIGSSIVLRFVQALKALSFIVLMVLGRVIWSNDLQP
jgi:hypothetical protein